MEGLSVLFFFCLNEIEAMKKYIKNEGGILQHCKE